MATGEDLERLADELADLAETLTSACGDLQRERGATDPSAAALQHVEPTVRAAADALKAHGPAVEQALASLRSDADE